MRAWTSAIVIGLCAGVIAAADRPVPQLPAETAAQKEARLQWWTDARFGMFIHWGLYALPARHEWVKKNERITDADYQPYFDAFDPDLYNPQEWARQARQAGMKYAVITAKHHEGFCLFDSKFTDYKAPEHAGEARPDQAVGRGVPGGGPQGRLLLLAARLAPPLVHRSTATTRRARRPTRSTPG